jgi:hypothetical protein
MKSNVEHHDVRLSEVGSNVEHHDVWVREFWTKMLLDVRLLGVKSNVQHHDVGLTEMSFQRGSAEEQARRVLFNRKEGEEQAQRVVFNRTEGEQTERDLFNRKRLVVEHPTSRTGCNFWK